jgi:hypothetical protein
MTKDMAKPESILVLVLLAFLAGCNGPSGGDEDADADAIESPDAEIRPETDADAAPDPDAPGETVPETEGDPIPDPGDADSPPPATLFDEMILRSEGGRLALPSGTQIGFSGAISCCMGGYGWPLFDEPWVDYVSSKGVNFLHVRLGPFLTGSGGETDWAAVGGGYAEVEGRADLTAWNGAFWSRVRQLIEYAGSRGIWVEVDVADGWAVKHCQWGDLPGYSAWDDAFNVQGEDWCTGAGSAAIAAGSAHDLWVRKVFEETGKYGNVIYQDGNEIGLVGGYSPEWTLSIQSILRDVEARSGYRRHILGTNSGNGAAMQADRVDYIELHQNTAPDPAGCFGKPCLCNEYNPNPAMTPEELLQQYCDALSWGTYFWYWRHGQTQEQMDRTLTLIQLGCG